MCYKNHACTLSRRFIKIYLNGILMTLPHYTAEIVCNLVKVGKELHDCGLFKPCGNLCERYEYSARSHDV